MNQNIETATAPITEVTTASNLPPAIRSGSSMSDDTKAMLVYQNQSKSTGLAFALWFMTGWLGGHRFYLGQTGTAITMLCIGLASIPLTFIIVGVVGWIVLSIWMLVDLFLIGGMVRQHNEQLITRLGL